MKIFKYRLDAKRTIISMPEGSHILCVQAQFDQPHLWALVDETKPTTPRNFEIVATGEESNVNYNNYIGTFQQMAGALIFHVFEV